MRAVALLPALLLLVACVPQEVTAPLAPRSVIDQPVPPEQIAEGENRFPIEVGGRFGFIDRTGTVLIEPRFDEAGQFSEGLARVREGGLWGYVRPDGSFAVAPRFLQAWDFAGGRARVVPEGAGYDLGSRQALPEDRYFQTFVTPAGEAIVEADLADARDFAVVGEGALAPAVRVQAQRMVPLGIDFLGFLSPTLQVREIWTVVEPDGDVAFTVPGADRMLGFAEGLAAFRLRHGWFRRQARWGFIDTAGTVVVPPEFDVAGSFSEGLAAVAEGGTFGYIDPIGRVVIPTRFEQAGPFREERARVKVGGKWGYIDPQGRIIIEAQFDSATDFREGLAAVSRDGRFGFIDRAGDVAIPLTLDHARPFRNGLALVRTGTRRGYIDREGEFVWEKRKDEE